MPSAEALDAPTAMRAPPGPHRTLLARDRYITQQANCASTDGDVVALFAPERSREASVPGSTSCRASLQAIIAKEYCRYDCQLIYLPMLPDTLAGRTLETLLDSLISWLRPHGEIIVCALTATPEPSGSLAASDSLAAVVTPDQLLQVAHSIDGVSARVHCEKSENLAFLHLQRH